MDSAWTWLEWDLATRKRLQARCYQITTLTTLKRLPIYSKDLYVNNCANLLVPTFLEKFRMRNCTTTSETTVNNMQTLLFCAIIISKSSSSMTISEQFSERQASKSKFEWLVFPDYTRFATKYYVQARHKTQRRDSYKDSVIIQLI